MFAHARNKHQTRFHSQGKAINDKIRLYSTIGHALLQARNNGDNAFDAIEQVMPWEAFVQSITEADRLARPGSFDHFAKTVSLTARIATFKNTRHIAG